jgi:1-acyl-sn-glycerol-3-phosphate acyltransferase
LGSAFFLTNRYGFRLRKLPDPADKKRLRLEYSQILLSRLNISVKVENAEKLPLDGQYLLFSNHRSIIDPLVIDIAFKDSKIFGLWVSKKELYDSLFFGMAVRNGGCVRVDREENNMGLFFSDIKKGLAEGSSIFIFPEGTRNKSSQDILEFKKGFRAIALKNRLPMLPVYIKTNTGEVLKKALQDSTNHQEITIVIGDTIDSKEKDPVAAYRAIFGLES